MTKNGWRTVLIESGSELSAKDDCLLIKKEANLSRIPMDQIGILLIDEGKILFSANLLSKLTSKNIKTIFCNEKHTPQCEIIPYCANSMITANFKKQIKWDENAKDLMWQKIVKDKIKAQACLIENVDQSAFEKLNIYYSDVEPGDKTNREAQAARVYFNALFGYKFCRRTESSINHALNYGYAILLSAVNRFVSIHGYHTAIGINHKSDNNQYNLSCDLMEPFRPIIDGVVFQNQNRELDFFYKKEIISCIYSDIKYNGKNTKVISAIEDYVEFILKQLPNCNEIFKNGA